MDQNQRTHLEQEIAKGQEYERVFNAYIKPFIEVKQQQLYQLFTSIPLTDVENLKAIKAQSTAIAALEMEFITFINTGKLAAKQLEN